MMAGVCRQVAPAVSRPASDLLWGYNMTIVRSRTAGRRPNRPIGICRLRVVCAGSGGTGASIVLRRAGPVLFVLSILPVLPGWGDSTAHITLHAICDIIHLRSGWQVLLVCVWKPAR